MNFVSYKQLISDVIDWASKLPRDFDAIVGIERSGMLPASILAMHLHKPLLTVNDFEVQVKGRQYANSKIALHDIQKVLVIDDSVSSGATMRDVRLKLQGLLYGLVKYARIKGGVGLYSMQ